MTAVVADGPVLSDSLSKTRPHFQAYLLCDTNANGTAVDQIEKQRRQRHMKFPCLVGRTDVDSFKDPQNVTDPAYKKWNDEGDYRPPAPYRSCDNIIDPVSGFVSVAGDKDRNTGHTHIPTLVQLNTTPQSRAPHEIDSIRAGQLSAPPETQRTSERDPGAPYAWNSRKVSDAVIRSNLGGWTSDVDPRKVPDEQTRNLQPFTPGDENKLLRERLAHRYVYTSSTQRAYEQVPWEHILVPKLYPPTSTLEEKADMISQHSTLKRYQPSAEEWQKVGRSWDWFQTRKGYYKNNIPIPGIVFCSPCPRAQHVPLYGGCVGAENLDEIDNANEPFQPFTVKRNPQPWPTETAHRPNIPRYTGCTWYRPDSMPAHFNQSEPMSYTSREHRPFNVGVNDSPFRRASRMSKMVTTVPPCNPFTKVTQPEEPISVE